MKETKPVGLQLKGEGEIDQVARHKGLEGEIRENIFGRLLPRPCSV